MSKRKARSLLWSARARRGLDQIAGSIARDKRAAARNGIVKLRKAAEGAARMPLAGRLVPGIQREDVREVLLRSDRIVYGVRDDQVLVFTVFGGGEQISANVTPEP